MEDQQTVKTEEVVEKSDATPEESSSSETEAQTEQTAQAQSEPVEKEETKVPLDELVKERRRRRELEDRLANLESQVRSFGEPDLVGEVGRELGLEGDQAAKLVNAVKKISGKQVEQNTVPYQREVANFQRRATEASIDFPDWNQHQVEMQKIFDEKFRTNPQVAFNIDPVDYYQMAKGRRGSLEREQGARDAINKVNQRNLASSESGRSGTHKRVPSGNKITRKWIQSLSPKEYDKHREKILDEVRRNGGYLPEE